MKIVVVACSPRKTSCSTALARAFAAGAEAAGNEVRFHVLAGEDIHGCQACRYCYTHDGACVQKDAIAPVIDDMRSCEMLVLATPTYYYSLPAQTKMVLDRMYARHGKPLSIRKSAMLVTLEDSEDAIGLIKAQYQTAVNYMGWQDVGVVCAGGMSSNTVPQGHPALKKAEELGRSLAVH